MQPKTVLVFHVLRNYPPSNLNRNKDGYPKNADFGGVMRGRISSQSLKRALRMSYPFDEFREEGLLDIRTRILPQFVTESLTRRGVDASVISEITSRLHELGRKEDAGKGDDHVDAESGGEDKKKKKKESAYLETKQLVRCAPAAIEKLCDQLLALHGSAKWGKRLDDVIETLDVYGVDTALFGMMSTSAAWSNVVSACQVGHAISVNKSRLEYDYFTAVDDELGETAMIGDTMFNSNAYYWSIAVSLDTLLQNLQGDAEMAKRALRAMVEAIFVAHPSGKQSTFFAQPPIALFLAEKRVGTAMDYSNAFEKPIKPDENSLVENAISALCDYIPKIDSVYQLPVERRHVALNGTEIHGSEQLGSWGDIAQWINHSL